MWRMYRLRVIAALVLPTLLLLAFVGVSKATNPPMHSTAWENFTGTLALPPPGSMLHTLEMRPLFENEITLQPMPVVENVITTPAPPAAADDATTTAVINAGRWLDLLQEIILAVLGAVLAFVSYKVPAIVRPFFMNKRMKELYTNAVYQMIAKARAAGDIGPDGTMSIDVGSKWIKDVVEYADKNADAALKDWVGDPVAKAKAFTEMILASTGTEYKPKGNVAVATQQTQPASTSNFKQPPRV